MWYTAFCKAGGANTFIADVVMPDAAYDFKFNCRPVESDPTKKRMTQAQRDHYFECTGHNVQAIACDGRDCSGC